MFPLAWLSKIIFNTNNFQKNDQDIMTKFIHLVGDKSVDMPQKEERWNSCD